MSDSVRPHRRQPMRFPRPWDSPGKNTGVGCHFLLQCMTVKSESEVARSCPTLSNPMDCSPPGSYVHGTFQARVLSSARCSELIPRPHTHTKQGGSRLRGRAPLPGRPFHPVFPASWACVKVGTKTSLVARWIRICLSVQGTQVRSLVWEDSTCRRATKSGPHDY